MATDNNTTTNEGTAGNYGNYLLAGVEEQLNRIQALAMCARSYITNTSNEEEQDQTLLHMFDQIREISEEASLTNELRRVLSVHPAA